MTEPLAIYLFDHLILLSLSLLPEESRPHCKKCAIGCIRRLKVRLASGQIRMRLLVFTLLFLVGSGLALIELEQDATSFTVKVRKAHLLLGHC